MSGVMLGYKNILMNSVGCYVSGGKYLLVVLVYMSVLIVKVVGVKWVIVCVLFFNGKLSFVIVVVMYMVGVDEIYCFGGV